MHRGFGVLIPGPYSVDATFLTGKYKGQILTAIATDGNNQVLPVAYTFVESENTDN